MAQKPEFLVAIALSLNPTEFWGFEAKNREFEPFPELVPANLKIAIFGCPDLGPEPRPEDKNQANDAFGGFEFVVNFGLKRAKGPEVEPRENGILADIEK